MANAVSSQHSIEYGLRRYLERHIVSRVALCAGKLSSLQQLCAVDLLDSEILKCNRKANADAEIKNFFQLILRDVLQHQLGNYAESNLLTVIFMMGLFNAGQAVMYCVRR